MVTEMVKPGYQKAEAYIIPDDWKVKNFVEVMDGFASGQTPYRAKPEYYKGNIPWITSGELNYNIITDTIEKITPKALHDTNLKMIPKGTFLFAITGLEAEGTRGSCAITGIEATTNQSCMALYPKKGMLTTNYLFHYYVNFGKRLALVYCQGTKQQSYNAAIAKLLPIILPPTIEEQSAIASVLSDTDALIESLNKLITKKKNIKQGAMQELLTGKIRLPGFVGGWVTKEIWQFTSAVAGGTPSTLIPKYWGGDIKWMNSGELNNKKIYDVEGRITDLGFSNSSTRLVPEKCILVGLAGQGKTRGTVAINLVPLCINQSIGAILPNESFVPEFLYYNFDSRYEEIRSMSTGVSGRGALNLGIIKKIPVNMPPTIEEQSAIASVLSDMDTEIEELEKRRDKYLMIKKGMMQQLLTGSIRLR
jgi:type I restriction enzyme, S subunit